jgi:RNA polymerase sigma factor (sigma-70 family)
MMIGSVTMATLGTRQKARLVLRHRRLVYKVCHHLGVGQDEDAKQDGFVGLIRAVEHFDPTRGTFPRYAWQCIARAVQIGKGERSPISYAYSQYRRYHNGEPPFPLHCSLDGTCREPAVEEDLEGLDRYDPLYKVLRFLNDSERDLIDMKYWRGLSNRDIALRLGVHEETARRRVNAAVSEVGRLLGSAIL